VDVVDIALQVTEALERCGIGYFLGGSLASSFQGEPRATNDVDLFILRASSFDRSEFARRRRVEVRAGRAAKSPIGSGETWSRCSGSRGRSSTTGTWTNGASSSEWATCSCGLGSRPGNRPP